MIVNSTIQNNKLSDSEKVEKKNKEKIRKNIERNKQN